MKDLKEKIEGKSLPKAIFLQNHSSKEIIAAIAGQIEELKSEVRVTRDENNSIKEEMNHKMDTVREEVNQKMDAILKALAAAQK